MATILIALSWRAFAQTSYWRNSETLWNHTLAVSPANDMAHTNLGYLFLRRSDFDQAISHFEKALEIRSSHAFGHYKRGGALIENNLAVALTHKGLLNEAIDHYEKAANMRPDYGDAYLNLGSILFGQGRTDEAIALWRKAASTLPEDAGFHTLLGDEFLKKGLPKDAIAEYEHATRIFPRDFVARNNLAWLLATSSDGSIRDGERAIGLAEQAAQLSSSKDANYLRTLAAAYAEVGRFSDAVTVAQQAAALATMQGKADVVNRLKKDLVLYQEQVPLRETPTEN
jgi:tetratricopeptide (TPR) repeat protein